MARGKGSWNGARRKWTKKVEKIFLDKLRKGENPKSRNYLYIEQKMERNKGHT